MGKDEKKRTLRPRTFYTVTFNTILGKTNKNGHWLDLKESKKNENDDEQSQSIVVNDDDMYVFEGIDYRGAAQKADIDLFDRLVLNDENTGNKTASSSLNQRVSERPQRRQMTEEEKAGRAAKMRETKARWKQEIVEQDHSNSSGF
jgi:hypothetical protein